MYMPLLTGLRRQIQRCCAQSLSRVRLFVIPGTVACQAPLSMEVLQVRILERVAMTSSREIQRQEREKKKGWVMVQTEQDLIRENKIDPQNLALGGFTLGFLELRINTNFYFFLKVQCSLFDVQKCQRIFSTGKLFLVTILYNTAYCIF